MSNISPRVLPAARLALALVGALSLVGCGAEPAAPAPAPSGDPVEEVTGALNAAAGNSLVAGFDFTCVILEGGAVKCWGSNQAGQLGLGSTGSVGWGAGQMGNSLPTVSLGKGLVAKALAAGVSHTCALLTTGQVKCWGDGVNGAIGTGDSNNRGDAPGEMGDALPFVDLGTGRTAKVIAAGGYHTCAILDTNQVKCWGAGSSGQLGVDDTSFRGNDPGEMGDALPIVNLGAGRTATALALTGLSSCALLDDGTVKCWGAGARGVLGTGSTANVGTFMGSMAALQPVNFGTGLKAKAITSGFHEVCVLVSSTNQLKCWGGNQAGQLGVGSTVDLGDGPGEMGDALPYVNIGSGTTVKAVQFGYNHACVILDTPTPPPGQVNTNQVKCWGENSSGGLGLGDAVNRGTTAAQMGDALPLVAIGQGRSARALAAGLQTCAILDTNQVKCWGYNGTGALGLGASGNRGDQANEMGDQLPIVQLGSKVTTVATMGDQFACARLGDGRLKCWGANDRGQLGLGDVDKRGDDPNEMGDNLPVVNLGTNLTVYSGAGSVISAGSTHACAVLNTRQVKCWGEGTNGRLGLGDTITRGDAPNEMGDNLPVVNLGTGKLAVQVSAGLTHTCARLSTNEVKCWGSGFSGQLGLGDTSSRGDGPNEMGDALPAVNLGTGKTATQVACGNGFTCALLNTGEVKCWGFASALPYGAGNKGDGPNEMGDALPAVPLGTGLTAKSISVGDSYACALLSNNQIKCWGSNGGGQLGQGDTTARITPAAMGDALPAIALGTGRTAKAVYASGSVTCALLDTNQLKCWGSFYTGLGDMLAHGDQPSEMGDYLPALFLGTGRTVTSLGFGPEGSSFCALLDTRQLKCWGVGDLGALGNGSTNSYGLDVGTMGDNLPVVDLGQEL
jgi:alpha-tubulin suppressor-like RCC1 family protein